VSYNPNILPEVLRTRSLSRRALSERIGVGLDELNSELRRHPEPRQGILSKIARELALPEFVFFMSRAPKLSDVIPDFRSEKPAPSPKARSTTESIQFADTIQGTAKQLDVKGADELPNFEASGRDQIDAFALKVREFFEITLQDHVDAENARVFYNICRKRIEDRGIFVLHESFPEADGSGFCLAHETYPVIVINTKNQTRGRRLFTLIHELAHVLMGQTGISDPFVSHNSVERRCNQFAASFLVPTSYATTLLRGIAPPRTPDLDDVARLSRRLKISQQATVLRLEELQLLRSGSHQQWLVSIRGVGNPDYSERGGGSGGAPAQEKIKLAKYGFHFASAFGGPLRQGRISELDLYRATGLKPKYQRAYFDFAQSFDAADLQDLERGDV
jgi:Zn-dependent peptidase ImmA (M78 family)